MQMESGAWFGTSFPAGRHASGADAPHSASTVSPPFLAAHLHTRSRVTIPPDTGPSKRPVPLSLLDHLAERNHGRTPFWKSGPHVSPALLQPDFLG